MHRPNILIISDESHWSSAVTTRWMAERSVPSFMLRGSHSCRYLADENFDIAVAGGLSAESLDRVLECLQAAGKPLVHVGCANRHSRRTPNQICLPECSEWADMLVMLLTQILERQRASSQAARLREINSELEHQATLGRYMLEMRHNLNNALTSILGNSELMLLEPDTLPSAHRAQLETIRNMGLRINEILQRFSSLQKEMQLVEEQSSQQPSPQNRQLRSLC